MSESQDFKKMYLKIPTDLDERIDDLIEIINSEFGIKINKQGFIIQAIENEWGKKLQDSTMPYSIRWKGEKDAKEYEENLKEEFMKYNA